jgi:hypothetical protein
MKKAVIEGSRIRRRGPGWQFVAWAALLAFALQAFVTATHIHPALPAGAVSVKALQNTSPQHKLPGGNDQSECPFCQAVVHAGAFLASNAPLPLLPAVWAEFSLPHLVAAWAQASLAHSWQSRASPQA